MQKLTALIFSLLFVLAANAQLKIMFVDDSGDSFSNSEYLASALDSLGYENLYLYAYDNQVSPPAEEMAEYDIVIWHTSSWGLDLQLWGGADTTNAAITTYLSLPNANLWLIGNDFLFDRYGSLPPVSFGPGEFPYDYLGISTYDVQSYADDGGLGVPLVTPAPDQPVTGIGDIDWQFSSLWYADGFALRPEAQAVYQFGGTGYPLEGAISGVWYNLPAGGHVLTYGFDLSLASSFDLIKSNVGSVLGWWEDVLISGVQSPDAGQMDVTAIPTVFTDRLNISIKTRESTVVSTRIFNGSGRLVAQLTNNMPVTAGEEINLKWDAATHLPAGIYYCIVQSATNLRTLKLVKQ